MPLVTFEQLSALQKRRRSFDAALADLRVQGALIAATPGRVPHFCTCPCCGYPTISPLLYDVCTICRWVDDGHDDSTADEIDGGANGDYSLAQARSNFIVRHTMYRATDPRCDEEVTSARERDRLIEAYVNLLPDVDVRAFIGALRRITALESALEERRHGTTSVRKRYADETHESRQTDREWEIWRAIADAAQRRSAPGVAEIRRYQPFQAFVSDITARLEQLLGPAAPTVTHRGLWYRCWSSGEPSAWVRSIDRRWAVEFEPPPAVTSAALFLQDDGAPANVAACIAAFFASAGPAGPVPGSWHSAAQD